MANNQKRQGPPRRDGRPAASSNAKKNYQDSYYYSDFQKESNEIYSHSSSKKGGKSGAKKKTPRKILVRNIAIVVLSVIVGLVGGVMVYGYSLLDTVNYDPLADAGIDSNANLTDSNDVSGKTDSALEDYEVETVGSLIKDPMVQNIMLFGSDARPNESGYGRSDTMILLSIDNRRQKLKLTSFLRDTWVNIPDHGTDRLNAAYSLGGPKLAISTIERNFGIDIDRYAVVDFSGFSKIIDRLGGIDIELTSDEVDYINWQINKNNSNSSLLTNTGDGVYHLNGVQALWHSRNRTVNNEGNLNGDGDFGRSQRQRLVLETTISQFKSADIWQIREILVDILPMVTTNITQNEMMSLAANALKYMNYPMSQFRVPTSDNFSYTDMYKYGVTMSVLTINDMTQARKDLASFIYEDSVA